MTELVFGIDLVKEQVRIAAGEPLAWRQEDVQMRGAAIECRIYAEDPANNFFPSPGLITRLQVPAGPGIRRDSGVYEGWQVPLEYDPLLSKLAVWATDRPGGAWRACNAPWVNTKFKAFAPPSHSSAAMLEHPGFCGGKAGHGIHRSRAGRGLDAG